MRPTIVFGTDGWRAVIADDFTFANLEKVALATVRHLKRHPRARNGVAIGYDARFLSREFAERAAEVIANAGLRVVLSDRIATTPMISMMTRDARAAGGVVITASHNPARYNGYKIKGDFGGPAHPEMTARVEKELARLPAVRRRAKTDLPFARLVQKKRISLTDFHAPYLETLRLKVDLERIRAAGIRILFDAMHGAGMGVLPVLLPGTAEMRGDFNPSFGGANPEPLAQNLGELMRRVRDERFSIGIATDGDADRVGAVDEEGRFVDSHRMFSLLLKYLVEQKGRSGEVAKSFSVTTMVDEQCRQYGLTMHETPVGFKYLCRLMTERDILIAGEESGGLGVQGHLPERDGVYIGLLLCEMMVVRGKPLSALVRELMEEYGPHVFKRVDLHVSEKEKAAIIARFRRGLRTLAGNPVTDRKDTDGFKYFIDRGWLLVRASGTEPLIRMYAEAEDEGTVDAMLREAAGRG